MKNQKRTTVYTGNRGAIMNAVFIVDNIPTIFYDIKAIDFEHCKVKYGIAFDTVLEAKKYLIQKANEPKEVHLTDRERARILFEQINYAWEVMTEEEKEYVREKNKYRDIYEEQNAWAREHIREFGEE